MGDPAQASAPETFIAARLLQRYSASGRTAYTYLFYLRQGADTGALIPVAADVISAWSDQGSGFLPLPPETVIQQCEAIHALEFHNPPGYAPQSGRLTPHQRRQQMARTVQFTITPQVDDLVVVHLVSRALKFSPKGDRSVTEHWKPTDGGWYSAYRPHQE